MVVVSVYHLVEAKRHRGGRPASWCRGGAGRVVGRAAAAEAEASVWAGDWHGEREMIRNRPARLAVRMWVTCGPAAAAAAADGENERVRPRRK